MAVVDSTLTHNYAGRSGGAIRFEAGAGSYSAVVNSEFADNQALVNGGAIVDEAGFFQVAHSRISGNQAAQFGGGLKVLADGSTSFVEIRSNEFAGNSANVGGGMYGRCPANRSDHNEPRIGRAIRDVGFAGMRTLLDDPSEACKFRDGHTSSAGMAACPRKSDNLVEKIPFDRILPARRPESMKGEKTV